jgi:ActR/RegA family two-component response regulator
MIKILLIDDDPGTMDTTGRLLQFEGYDVRWCDTADDGIRSAQQFRPDLALIDLRLPDRSGLEVLEAIRTTAPATRCVMLTGYGGLDTAVLAMRRGATDYLQKPLIGDDLIAAIRRLVPPTEPSPWSADIALHARARWADVIARAVDAPRDPRTLHEWGRCIGASPGAIRNWCRTARLPARRSLLLARVLRAVIRQHHVRAAPEDLLDIVDRRTLVKLMTVSGGSGESLPPTIVDCLRRQRLIEDTEAIAVLERTLTHLPMPASHRHAS